MTPWRTDLNEYDDYIYSPQPLPDPPRGSTRLSASELRRSVGRRSFQGFELISAFASRFPDRPGQSIPNASPQPVEFNVNIFDAPPPDMSAAGETKVSSIESLHRYAQYTGRYPKLGLFDDPSETEEEEEESTRVNDDIVEDKGQESDHVGYGSAYEVGNEEEEHFEQGIPIPDGCYAWDRWPLGVNELLDEETRQDFDEKSSYGQGRSKSVVSLNADLMSKEKSASRNYLSTCGRSPGTGVRSRVLEADPGAHIKKPTTGGKADLIPRMISRKLQHKATQRRLDDHDNYSESLSEEDDDDDDDDDFYVPTLGSTLSRLSANTPSSASSTALSISRKRKRGGPSHSRRNNTATAASTTTTASTFAASVSASSSVSYKVVTERSGRTVYQCLLCPNFRTKALGDMTRHLESLIHQDRSYACDVAGCEGLFTRKDALVRHKKLVHDPSKSNKRKKAKKRLDC